MTRACGAAAEEGGERCEREGGERRGEQIAHLGRGESAAAAPTAGFSISTQTARS